MEVPEGGRLAWSLCKAISVSRAKCEACQVGLSIPEGGAIGRRLISLVVPVILGGRGGMTEGFPGNGGHSGPLT